MSELDRDIEDALRRAHAERLGDGAPPTRRHYRDVEPRSEMAGWGPLSFLKPATPWHLVGCGALLFFLGRLIRLTSVSQPLEVLGVTLLAIGLLSLVALPRSGEPKRWRGRLIYLDESWRARLYRALYKR